MGPHSMLATGSSKRTDEFESERKIERERKSRQRERERGKEKKGKKIVEERCQLVSQLVVSAAADDFSFRVLT